jgi:hypothetical protein
MLRARNVHVPQDLWFSGTVSRRVVRGNLSFGRLMGLVEQDQVGTVYVESQDRWGTTDRAELFTLLATLRTHGTKLFDLKAGKDLTERDLATELLAFIGSVKSEEELKQTAYRSLRTKVSLFQESGSWPSGNHPFGYGKRCYSKDGRLLWEWQPTRRLPPPEPQPGQRPPKNRKGGSLVGRLYNATPDGQLVPGPVDVYCRDSGFS